MFCFVLLVLPFELRFAGGLFVLAYDWRLCVLLWCVCGFTGLLVAYHLFVTWVCFCLLLFMVCFYVRLSGG